MRPPLKLYYTWRWLVPRQVQVALRRWLCHSLRRRNPLTWPIDAAVGQAPAGFEGWPEGKRFALVLRHDVEHDGGQDKCRHLIDIEACRGLRSAFYFVPERYRVRPEVRELVAASGGEVGVHGLKHDGKLYWSRSIFSERALKINRYLKEWRAVGFASPSSHHQLDWLHDLRIDYDTSTFDTDPFEPQPDALSRIFPLTVNGARGGRFVELPYTLPQDFTLFVLLREPGVEIWKQKLDWIAQRGGMALMVVHPDYVHVSGHPRRPYTYPIEFYEEFLDYVASRYRNEYWNPLPREMSAFWRSHDCSQRSREDLPFARQQVSALTSGHTSGTR